MTQPNKANAVVPDSLKALQEVRSLRNEAIASETGVTREEAALTDLSGMEGWGLVKKHITDEIALLDKAVAIAMGNGGSFEEIGAKALVATTVKEKLLALVEYVETTANYVQSRQTPSSNS